MKLLSAAAIRRCLIADPGHLIISADFDQIELRVAAALAGEQVLIDAAKRGEHLIKASAVQLFGENYTADEYRYTKNVTYGWLFGGGAQTLADQAGIPIGMAYGITRDYENRMEALTKYKRKRVDGLLREALGYHGYQQYRRLRARMFNFKSDTPQGRAARKAIQVEIDRLCYGKYGYVETHFGRRLRVDASKAYTIVNYEVQCTAADLFKRALLDVMDDPRLEPTVLLPVHDEILGQARKRKAQWTAERYGEVMSRKFKGVPITASGKVYGKSWGHGYSNAA